MVQAMVTTKLCYTRANSPKGMGGRTIPASKGQRPVIIADLTNLKQ